MRGTVYEGNIRNKHRGVPLPGRFAVCGGCPGHRTTDYCEIYDSQLTAIESEFVPLADAMPADKYDFAPSGGEFQGVRTFAQQVKHVASVIYMVAAAGAAGEAAGGTGGRNGPDAIAGKEQDHEVSQRLFRLRAQGHGGAHRNQPVGSGEIAFGTGEMSRAGAASIAVWHSFDHYGQMVVYARMNGIVPPASRQ